MPVLNNPKHEKVVQLVAKEGMTWGHAWFAEYECSTLLIAQQGVSEARRNNPEIDIRLAEILTAAAAEVVFTVADMARQLDEDREFARGLHVPGAAVTASSVKAKLFGMLTDRVDLTSNGKELRKLTINDMYADLEADAKPGA